MVKVVFALCLFMMPDNTLLEHRIQTSLSECMKAKRYAMKSSNGSTDYRCGQVTAELEENIDGSLTIKKIIQAK